MLSIRKLQNCAKEPKLHEGQTYIKAQKGGTKSSKGTSEQCCEISQPAKFACCEFLQPYKISTELLLFGIFAPSFLCFDHASSNLARVHRV